MLLPQERLLRAPSATDSGGNTSYVRPYFHVHRNAVDQTGIAIATATQIQFTTTAVDEGGYYNSTGWYWQPPLGKYLLGANVGLDAAGIADQAHLQIFLFKGGSAIGSANTFASGVTFPSLLITMPVTADGADVFTIFVTINGGAGTKTVKGDIDRTFFWGVPID